jgi:hypothetical protein
MTRTIRILFLAANPNPIQQSQVAKELEEVREKIAYLSDGYRFRLHHGKQMSLEQLQESILHLQPEIVHFTGAGSKESALVFQDPQGNSQIPTPDALADLFAVSNNYAKSVQCVILNGCYDESQAEVISKYVPCVIGTSGSIFDVAAIIC